MYRRFVATIAGLVGCFSSVRVAAAQEIPPVGPAGEGRTVVPTAQLVQPEGRTLEIAGRPVDVILSPDGAVAVAKDDRGLVVIDVAAWSVKQELAFKDDGGSMTGIAITGDGKHIFATTANGVLIDALWDDDGRIKVAREIKLSGKSETPYPCGLALTSDSKSAYVCLSRNNTLGLVDLVEGKLTHEIEVGVAPYAVRLADDGNTAFVTNWGGRRPTGNERAAPSSGTPALIDERGIAASGTVSIVDCRDKKVTAEIAVGLSPCGLALSADGRTLYVASANSDEVAFIDIAARRVSETLVVRPDAGLPFGSMPNGLALSPDRKSLLVSLAGNNAIAVVTLAEGGAKSAGIAGFIPTDWYPGAIAANDKLFVVANIKGVGSRTPKEQNKGWNTHWHRGTLSLVTMPVAAELRRLTDRARADARVPEALRSRERDQARADAKPVPVPAEPGQPSVFEHVFYVIKENRTYDQMFGDIERGNRDASLCIFPREISPNHHALADEFVLLDNFYCNGVLSADGHSWVTEGNVTPYLERSFGGFKRSYTFGDDPLTYSSSGFIWDEILAKGLSFRNYGEFDEAKISPAASYNEILKDWREKSGKIKREQQIGVERMKRYSCPDYPGWNMAIPDALRADVFLKEFKEFEAKGGLPNFVMIYLPNDHTSGTGVNDPTPRALVADNDLALGQIVDAISHSRYWARSCIFVIEDDPQNGFDHVDGHRSICLAVSPYTKRGAIVSQFYNQTSVVHTIHRIFGITATNQLTALAPVMTNCFQAEPNLKAYDCRPINVELGELNKKAAMLAPAEKELADASGRLDLSKPDLADEDTLNRILWHAMKGADAQYPAEWAGPHGRGLARLGLKLDSSGAVDDDDDDDDD
jgi:YVTN family beta-propeller protein